MIMANDWKMKLKLHYRRGRHFVLLRVIVLKLNMICYKNFLKTHLIKTQRYSIWDKSYSLESIHFHSKRCKIKKQQLRIASLLLKIKLLRSRLQNPLCIHLQRYISNCCSWSFYNVWQKTTQHSHLINVDLQLKS